MLMATGIHKSHDDLQVLRGVDVSLSAGEVVSIVGPSGAGKTTLLNVLSTLDRPDSGSVVVDGVELAGLRDKSLARFRNAKIGFVFQFHQLLPEFNALENAMLPALVGGRSEGEAEAAAMARLQELGLEARAKHLPSQLSGGEQQRVAVARALVNDPPLLFADEPSGNLDTANADALHDLFFDLRDRHGLTIALVTHNEGLAERADRQIRLRDGRIQS
ncbi:MAG: ABC transporter ATP-binding protein [Flavobacteriales bacterium]|nr:ABC transporter ATP-binding protein [Flavobacteriales bacterium]